MLKGLMDSHRGPQSMPIIDARPKLDSHKASVDEQEFSLIMSQLEYDRDAWKVHKHTCTDYNAAVPKEKHAWNLKWHEQAGKAADAFLKQHCLAITYDKDPAKPVMDFLNWRKAWSANLQIPEERAHTFALCNMSFPSMSQANGMVFFGACASFMARCQNPTAVIMPQLAYKKACSTWPAGRPRTSSSTVACIWITNSRSSASTTPIIGITASWCTTAT